MKRLTFTRPHRLSELADQLDAQLPALIGRAIVEGDGQELSITLPDDADANAVIAIVAAHVPTSPAPAPPRPAAAELAAFRDFMQGANPATIAALADRFRTFVRLYRYQRGGE